MLGASADESGSVLKACDELRGLDCVLSSFFLRPFWRCRVDR